MSTNQQNGNGLPKAKIISVKPAVVPPPPPPQQNVAVPRRRDTPSRPVIIPPAESAREDVSPAHEFDSSLWMSDTKPVKTPSPVVPVSESEEIQPAIEVDTPSVVPDYLSSFSSAAKSSATKYGKVAQKKSADAWKKAKPAANQAIGLLLAKNPIAIAAACVVALVVLIIIFSLAGGVSSSHQLDVQLVEDKDTHQPGIKVTITGKAADLAVIATDPTGKSAPMIISKSQMITGKFTTILHLDKDDVPGTCTFTLKTFEPERVVCTKSITLTLGKVWVEGKCEVTQQCAATQLDMMVNPSAKEQIEFKEIILTVKKNGNMPVIFNGSSISINGTHVNSWPIGKCAPGSMLAVTPFVLGDEGKVTIVVAQMQPVKAGQKVSISGELSYQNGKGKVPFQTEYVVR